MIANGRSQTSNNVGDRLSMDLTDSKGAQPIPKFGSFKPKPTPPVEARRDEEKPRHRDEGSRHRSRHHSHRHRSHSREKPSRHRSRREKESKDEPTEPPQEPAKPIDEASDLYVVDRKGDIYNLTYGTLHRYNIPLYRRAGQGGVIGLPRRFKIDRNYHDEGAVLIRADIWHGDGTRHKSKSLLSRTDTKESRLFRMRQNVLSDAEVNKDYVPLSSQGSRKRRRILGEYSPENLSDDEADKYAYRSIQGKAKPEQDVPSDMESASVSDSDGEGVALRWERDIRQRNSELLKKAEENPTDVNGWLEVIEYQHTLLAGSDGRRQLTVAEKRSLADIKLSLYNKALKKVGNRPGRDRLLLGYLEEGANLWESKKLTEQWNTILKHNPGYISLWVRYLDFRQSEFLDFTYERCRNIYLDCMKLNASTSDNAEKDVILTYLFLRMTLFIREAGFSEIAVGLWQAVLEFTLFRPDKHTNSLKSETLAAFSSFWDSEVARIGDPGAKGWKSGSSPEMEISTSASQTKLRPKSLFSSWSEAETRLGHSARLPARSVDEVENEDPYRVVLWSDIEEFLPFFVDWGNQNYLIENFLTFCHLPPLSSPESYEVARSFSGDAFLRNEMIYSDRSVLNVVKPEREYSQNDEPARLFELAVLQNMVHTVDSLFLRDDWFSSLAVWETATTNGESVIDAEWVRRALRLLVEASPREDGLAEYALAVEFVINSKDAKKFAKSLLKKRQSSLRLYNAFAIMECLSGNFPTATHVWATTLSMAANLSEVQKLEYGPLLRSWVWEYLTSDKSAQAVELLLSIPTFTVDIKVLEQASLNRKITPAEHLKALRFLNESSDHSLSIQNLDAFSAWTDLSVLLRYLTDSFNLSPAIDIYKNASTRLGSSSHIPETHKPFALELLYQFRSRLLYHHITSRQAYKPAEIRELLLESIKLFPNNTIFQSLFTWNESRFRIDERIRDVLLTPTSTSTTVSLARNGDARTIPITSSLLAISTELARPVYSGSTVHSARAAFERALSLSSSNTSDTSTKSNNPSSSSPSLSLWKCYIYFELRRAKNPAAAKQVFYRAVRSCPWSKDLLMLAFDEKLWRDSGEFDDWWELRRVYNVLVDKELRVHNEIDDELFDEAERIVVEKEENKRRYLERELGQGKGRADVRGRRRWTKGVIDLPEDKSSDDDMEIER